MPRRRILSLWFPRLAAERILRAERVGEPRPLAVVADERNMQVVVSLSAEAEAAGIRTGQPLSDARALLPALDTRAASPLAEAAFLRALRRWAGKFSPWVAEEGGDALIVDLTGCAHLFGGEEGVLTQATTDCADLGLTVQAGIADTPGGAWALARFAGQPGQAVRSGDAIDQEARATRSKAGKRHWIRGGTAPTPPARIPVAVRIAEPGRTRAAIAGLPVTALRLAPDTAAALNRLGLRRVADVLDLPRAATARRFGIELVTRIDQALGITPEPVSPARPPHHFACRLTLPEPIGLEADILAGLDRLLGPLCDRLRTAGRGARSVRLELLRADHSRQRLDAGLARPSADPDRIRPLIALKIGDADAGFGIDVLRLSAPVTEALTPLQHKGHLDAAQAVTARMAEGTALDDLVGRIGARTGLEAITRAHPADSHIPEKAATVMAAAFAPPVFNWPAVPAPRPVVLFAPEPVTPLDTARPPRAFRWRRRAFATAGADGPERIAPEWWLDDPAWRSGTRDYWCVTCATGERLWLYEAHGGTASGGWFAHGDFT